MKYLFAAIDARLARSKDGRTASQLPRASRAHLNPDELKRLIVEASEAVDDKSAANDFQETLERIVNEIRNTTEHSGPFLQKVRKADVPDYYDVIKRPMDLATLLKKVKQQAYRTKKAFAEDLDLIWSNCLLYNSHPNHPLRHSAEALRAKSNQLLEFITDPALTQRQLLVASMGSAAFDARRASSTRIGTPDEDADAEADSDDEGARSKRALSERLLNGVNGDRPRDSSASPGPSRSATPSLARRLSRKVSVAPLARITASPEPTPPPTSLPFEEHHAYVRTPQAMAEFLLLDQELTRLEGSGFRPVREAALLPASAFDPSSSSATALAPAHKKKKKDHLADLIARLNPDILPSPAPAPAATADTPTTSDASTPAAASSSSTAAVAPPRPPRNPDDPLESLWWDLVAPVPSSSLLFAGGPAPAPAANGANGHAAPQVAPKPALPAPQAMSAGMPHVPWVGYTASVGASAVGFAAASAVSAGANGKGKGKARAAEGKKRAAPGGGGGGATGLAPRMRRNCETLRRIRRVGDTLARESAAAGELGDLESPAVSSSEGEDEAEEEEGRPAKRRRGRTGLVRTARIPRDAMACPATAGIAAREAMRACGAGMLEHAGFEGTSGGALDVLGHLAGEYLSNLGRTLRFYADRYSSDLSEKEILTRTLSENGIPSPSHLSAYVSEDVDRYGQRLSDLLSKLERTRAEGLDAAFAPSSAGAAEEEAERALEEEDAFVGGAWSARVGVDYFGLREQGLDEELGVQSLVLPRWILRGEPRPLDSESTSSTLAYSPPPSFIPLPPSAIPSQIGLLQPYLSLRASHAALGLTEDPSLSPSALALAHPGRAKDRGTRHKVPPHGRIPFKGKRRPEDPVLPAAIALALQGASEPVKKKKKSSRAAALALVEEAVVGESGAE
ncbi:Transcriptional activator spt7 [Rhodotorula kratochvilovae]